MRLTCATREIIRRRSRYAVGLFGYALVVGMMVLLGSLLTFSQRATGYILNNLGTHFLVYFPVVPGIASMAGIADKGLLDPKNEGFFSDPAYTGVFPITVAEDIRKMEKTFAASPFLLFRFKDTAAGEVFTVGGFDPADPGSVNGTSNQKSDIIAGEWLTPTDRGQILVEEGYAQYRSWKVDARVTLAGQEFRVKGITRPGIRPAKADVYMHFADAEKAINTRLTTPLNLEANIVLVEVASGAFQGELLSEVKQRFPGCMIDTFDCYNPAGAAHNMGEKAVKTGMIILFGVLLLFALKSQGLIVLERKNDIAILRAVGWPDNDILGQVLVEAMIIAMAGGLLGCVAGGALMSLVPWKQVVSMQTPIEPVLAPLWMLISLIMSALTGLIAGWFPARRLLAQAPAQMLQRR